jgi:hypothetical protein
MFLVGMLKVADVPATRKNEVHALLTAGDSKLMEIF